MIGFAQWSNRRKAALAATLAFLLWAPSGLSQSTGPVVTGHTTFYKGEDFDPCLASIVGVMQTEVRWFNDMVLARRNGGKGTFIYITENGADDPRDKEQLYTDGVSYDFVDPNGAAWHVEELYYGRGGVGVTYNDQISNPDPRVTYGYQDRTYVWVVELSAQPIYDQFAQHLDRNDPNWHTIYNFVALVDTCKFHREEETNFNGNKHNESRPSEYDFNVTHDKNDPMRDDEWRNGHKSTDDEVHTHEAFLANIYVGKRPVVIVGGTQDTTSESSTWESSWTTSSQSQENLGRVPSETAGQAQGGG